ncbi:TerC family protein [Paenibacillus sp. NEAU-GSW1]|uniref:TerC family protein n=1 Tax=Paenibacillus sp. NEAU-GSW1 TaxID=2682486 RepID=UPI0012E26F90|nr:TerC family protein [Paenibacillus sp. NEAU-GSW1]MUT66221.1 YjbE family putative metal transport protein [Paenibacillus sp. NEAU-GSW1]
MDAIITFTEIVLINLLLSGDNAVVIAMASQHLPPHQRKKAVWWGALAAVGLRCLLTLAAISLLQTPYVQAVGAVLLLYIAVKLLVDAGGGGEIHTVKKAKSLSHAVRTIVAADFIMSLDNVLAIAAVAEGEPILILLGIGLSIPMIIWGSHLLTVLLSKFPALVYIGAGLLGFASGEMLVHDPGAQSLLFHGHDTLVQAIPLFCVPLVIIAGILWRRRA